MADDWRVGQNHRRKQGDKNIVMNMSITDILMWFSEVQLPGIRMLWTWFVTAPWWMAIGAVVLTNVVGRVILILSWNMYVKVCNASAALGELIGEYAYQAKKYFLSVKGLVKRIAIFIKMN